MVQIDIPKRHVYTKFRDDCRMQDVLHSTRGQVKYRYTNGEMSMVRKETAGLGSTRVRIENLPSEVSDGVLRTVLARCGEVKEVQEENWSHTYRYTIANGIRLAMISLVKHILSHITVAGNRVLVSYDGQPMTCYGCNETGHLYHVCPMLRQVRETVSTAAAASWADIAAGVTGKTRNENEETESTAQQCGRAGPAARKYGERDDPPP